MKYIVTLNGKEYEVVVVKDTAAILSVQDAQSPPDSVSN